ncbi:hypothetical protein MASR2M117_08030 [Paludibacter sp.]
MIKKYGILFICCVATLYSVAEVSPGGLLFTSSQEKVDSRTSLVVFSNKNQQFKDSFSLSFDLSIWDQEHFGHIFRVIDDKRHEVEFVFVNFYGVDNMYLDFHSPITHQSVQIPFSKDNIDKKTVLPIIFHFNLVSDKVIISLNEKQYVCESVGLKNPSDLQIAFGLFGLNLDVPQMVIKNLKITTNTRKIYFPLNESKGDVVEDVNERFKANVKNPNWIINDHFYWHKKANLKINNSTSITFDENQNRILLINNDSIFSYFPRYDKLVKNEIIKPADINIYGSLFDPSENKYYLFTEQDIPQKVKFSNMNDEHMSFSIINKENKLHSNPFLTSDELYFFGGYSNHLYSNDILKYNSSNKKWNKEVFKGEKITPRFYSAIGQGVEIGEMLLFGGFGNETGRQEHGGKNLYDLYKLDINRKVVQHLWTLQDHPKIEFIAGNNLILSQDKTHFYAFCYAHHTPKTVGYLYSFDLKSGKYEIMSDSIQFTSEDMNTTVNLFFNQELNEFYTVIKENFESGQGKLQIFSLSGPPVSKAYLERGKIKSLLSYVFFSVVSIISIVVVVFVMFSLFKLFRKNKNSKTVKELVKSLHLINNKVEPTEKKYKKSSVYLFGNFTVYDKNGQDISYRLGMKLKTLFSLILLNTNGENGITTEQLTISLWPEKDVIDAKNIRGVTINRLRNILDDIEGISLIHQNHQWRFVFSAPFFCDYLEYQKILNNINHSGDQGYFHDSMTSLYYVLNNGQFLLNVQDVCIDPHKSLLEEKISKLLKEYISTLYKEKRYQEVIKYSNLFFVHDPLDQEVCDMLIKSYKKTGKNDEAKAFMKAYKRSHLQLLGEDFDF